MSRVNALKNRSVALALVLLLAGADWSWGQAKSPQKGPQLPAMEKGVTQGALRVKTAEGVVECPLKHTAVKVTISGFIARATVTQTFHNPYNEKIEAVYVFPLSHTGAVDDMTMVIGKRRIVGVIKRRAEARAIYEAALRRGATASLLEQERPNIFTQSVGNIPPKSQVLIQISYVDVLPYDMGTYEFQFPMVVGPRFIPGAPISKKAPVPPELKGKVGTVKAPQEGPGPRGTGWSPDTSRVPDASRITPPVLKPGYRTGHDVSLSVELDAGVPVQDLKVVNHQASIQRTGRSQAAVKLSPADSLPNKDFVLSYKVVGEKPELATLAHSKGPGQGYFLLMIQPRLEKELAKAPPREVVFLIDVSGSMGGRPTEKVRQTMREFFKLSKPQDTIQVITFASYAQKVFERAVPANRENVRRALGFTRRYRSGGGTRMLEGIKLVLAEPLDPKRVRIVVMLSDGYIGNEAEIIREVGRRSGDQIRFWALGIGSSPNRFLIDGVAKSGGGMSAVVGLKTDPAPLVRKIVERIHRAQLAKIRIDWKGLPVYETYPRRIPELWAGRPVMVYGRYEDGGKATIQLSGLAEGKPLSYTLDVSLPRKQEQHDVLAKVWARKKIADLMEQMYYAGTPEIVEEVTQVALKYRLMSQYTSFVAVDESQVGQTKEPAKPPRRMLVPLPLPEGVSFEGVFGGDGADRDTEAAFDKPALKRYQAVRKVSKKTVFRLLGAGGHGGGGMGKSGGEISLKSGVKYHLGGPAVTTPPVTTANKRVVVSRAGYRGRQVVTEKEEEKLADYRRGLGYLEQRLFRGQAQARLKEAKEALALGDKLQKEGQLEAALRHFQRALVLESAYLSAYGYSRSGTAAAAMAAMRKLLPQIRTARIQKVPTLGKRLELVLDNVGLEQAVQAVAQAAGMKAEIIKGSLKDARAMKNTGRLWVTYLDLRGATVGQALDWLLTPAHLSWQVSPTGTITVGTMRRMGPSCVWVYPVGDLTLPLPKELKGKQNQQELEKRLEAFVAVVRVVLGQPKAGAKPTTVLMDAGRLLVWGDAPVHARVEALLEALQSGKGDPEQIAGRKLQAADVQAVRALMWFTSARWAARQTAHQTRRVQHEQRQVVQSLDGFSWKLLASICQGKADPEALAHLKFAYQSPHLSQLLIGSNAVTVARSTWVLAEAARIQPQNQRLKALATAALQLLPKLLSKKTQKLDKARHRQAVLPLLYALLAVNRAQALGLPTVADDEQLLRRARFLLTGEGNKLWYFAQLAALLLEKAPAATTEQQLRAEIRGHKVRGNDLVVLTALAAKRRGGKLLEAWQEEMTAILGNQPLSGSVVIAVNRLTASRAPLLAGP